MTNKTETTLRALVDGRNLSKVKLPEHATLKATEANAFASWARAFSGVCLTDIDIMVSDVRPSAGLKVMCDLDRNLAKKIRPLFEAAHVYGFGLRLFRETTNQPYELSIVRRVIDSPQLTLPRRSMLNFMEALGLVETNDATLDRKLNISTFADTLHRHHKDCLDAGVGHYASYAQRIIEYGIANGATELVWGPERRGSPEIAEAA